MDISTEDSVAQESLVASRVVSNDLKPRDNATKMEPQLLKHSATLSKVRLVYYRPGTC